MQIVNNVSDLIGNTPMVRLKTPDYIDSAISIFGKLESFNPGHSVKDRTAIGLIRDAEDRGLLHKGYTIVESTSGNLGHSLAMISAVRGYKFIAVVDPKTPRSNLNLYRLLNAEVEMVTEKDELGGYQTNRIRRAREIAATMPHTVNLDQYANPAAQHVHYQTTGAEIYAQMNGQVDVLVANASTGSHLCGTARYLKERNSDLTVVGVEPVGSVVFGGERSPYLMNGTGLSFVPDNFDPSIVDRKIKVTDAEAFYTARDVARDNGLILGGSSGAALYAAFQHAKTLTAPQNIVTILADDGAKYMDTIYDDQWMESHGMPVPRPAAPQPQIEKSEKAKFG